MAWADEPPNPFYPTPWRIEEDWTLEVTDAKGAIVFKLPLQRYVEARRIVEAVNAAIP